MAKAKVYEPGDPRHCGNAMDCPGSPSWLVEFWSRGDPKMIECYANCPGRKRDGVAWIKQRVAADDAATVYFIQAGNSAIKIGVAGNVKSRLQSLQTAHHEELTVLALTNGGRMQELAYHSMFRADHLRGEWFARSPSIMAEVKRLQRIAKEQSNEG